MRASASAAAAEELERDDDPDEEPRELAEPDAGAVDEPAPVSIARTEGQRLLMLAPGSLQQTARAVGATKQAVSLWRTGARIPEERWRRKLHALHGIPPDAWERVPAGSAAASPNGSAASSPAVEWFPSSEPAPSALDDCNRLLNLLRSQLNRTDLLGRERVQLGDSFSRALAQKERLERAREMLETRTIREHPEWQRLKRVIIGALLPHPAAAQAVEAAITRVLGDDAGPDAH